MQRFIVLVTMMCVHLYGVLAKSPNFVVVLTDDQDAALGSFRHMPKVQELLIDQGTTFANAFVTTPVCCPSRSSILTGRYIHNHGAHNNSNSGDCSSPTWQKGPEKETLAVYLRNAKYNTFYGGKYLNGYGSKAAGGVAHVPPGWHQWLGLVGNSVYYNYTLSDNGTGVHHKDDYATDYLTDVLNRRLMKFLDHETADRPFFAMVGTPAAHAPFTPAPKYQNEFAGLRAPRNAAWNASTADKHHLLRAIPPYTSEIAAQSDYVYRRRLQTLLSVDDLVGDIVAKLNASGLLDNTYIIYTADNGFHLGQFGMAFDKRQLYEADIRVPMVVRGPGVTHGLVAFDTVLSLDLAPTIVDLATGSVPDTMDGRSMRPLLVPTKSVATTLTMDDLSVDGDERTAALASLSLIAPAAGVSWRRSFLVEYFGEQDSYTSPEICGSGTPLVTPCMCDEWNNTYACVRTLSLAQSQSDNEKANPHTDDNTLTNSMFCQFTCYDGGYNIMPCDPATAEGTGEYYDMTTDHWQLHNTVTSLSPADRDALASSVKMFKTCAGQRQCNPT